MGPKSKDLTIGIRRPGRKRQTAAKRGFAGDRLFFPPNPRNREVN
jgi:hypothetical protein